MTRESRHLHVANVPAAADDQRLVDFFSSFGRVQKVDRLDANSAVVSFMDVRSAQKANGEHRLDTDLLRASFYEQEAAVNRSKNGGGAQQQPGTSGGNQQQPRDYYQNRRSTSRSRSNAVDGNRSASDRHTALGSSAAVGSTSVRYPHQPSASSSSSATAQPPPQTRRTRPTATERRSWDERSNASSHHSRRSGNSTAVTTRRNGDAKLQSPVVAEPTPSSNSKARQRSNSTESSASSGTSLSPSASTSSRGSKSRREETATAIVDLTTAPPGSSSSASLKQQQRADTESPTAIANCEGLIVRNLPLRSTDSSLKDGLYFTFKKTGKVLRVNIDGEGDQRHALVVFKKPVDIDKAVTETNGQMFFGSKIRVDLAPTALLEATGAEVEADPKMRSKEPEAVDEHHPRSSRTLYVGNLERRISEEGLKDRFGQYGIIVDVDVKNRESPAPFAFVQFADISSVVRAMQETEQKAAFMGKNRLKVGFGRTITSNIIWVDELPPEIEEEYLLRKMKMYGEVKDVLVDPYLHQALITYGSAESAQDAVKQLKARTRTIGNVYVQVDYGSDLLQDLFIDRMFRSKQLANKQKDVSTPLGSLPPAPPTFSAAVPAPVENGSSNNNNNGRSGSKAPLSRSHSGRYPSPVETKPYGHTNGTSRSSRNRIGSTRHSSRERLNTAERRSCVERRQSSQPSSREQRSQAGDARSSADRRSPTANRRRRSAAADERIDAPKVAADDDSSSSSSSSSSASSSGGSSSEMDEAVSLQKRKPSEADMDKLMQQRSHILNELKGDGDQSSLHRRSSGSGHSSPAGVRDRSLSANSANSRPIGTTPTRPSQHKLSEVFDLDWQKSPKRMLQRQNSISTSMDMDTGDSEREPVDSLEARLQQFEADRMDDTSAHPSTSHAYANAPEQRGSRDSGFYDADHVAFSEREPPAQKPTAPIVGHMLELTKTIIAANIAKNTPSKLSGTSHHHATHPARSVKDIPLTVAAGHSAAINDPRTAGGIRKLVDLPVPAFATQLPPSTPTSSPVKRDGGSGGRRTSGGSELAAGHQIQSIDHPDLVAHRSLSRSASNSSDPMLSPDAQPPPITPTTDIFGNSLQSPPLSASLSGDVPSFQERIRALDAKFQSVDETLQKTKKNSSIDYDRAKYVVKKRTEFAWPPNSSVESTNDDETPSRLFKSSIFEQDLERLRSMDEKYSLPATQSVFHTRSFSVDERSRQPVVPQSAADATPPMLAGGTPVKIEDGHSSSSASAKSTPVKVPLSINIPPAASSSSSSAAPLTPSLLSPLHSILKKAKTPTPTGPITPIGQYFPPNVAVPPPNFSVPPPPLPSLTSISAHPPPHLIMPPSSIHHPTVSSSAPSTATIDPRQAAKKDGMKSPDGTPGSAPPLGQTTNSGAPRSSLVQTQKSWNRSAPLFRPTSQSFSSVSDNLKVIRTDSVDVTPSNAVGSGSVPPPSAYNVDPRRMQKAAPASRPEKTFGLRHDEHRPSGQSPAVSAMSTPFAPKQAQIVAPSQSKPSTPTSTSDKHHRQQNKEPKSLLDELFRKQAADTESTRRELPKIKKIKDRPDEKAPEKEKSKVPSMKEDDKKAKSSSKKPGDEQQRDRQQPSMTKPVSKPEKRPGDRPDKVNKDKGQGDKDKDKEKEKEKEKERNREKEALKQQQREKEARKAVKLKERARQERIKEKQKAKKERKKQHNASSSDDEEDSEDGSESSDTDGEYESQKSFEKELQKILEDEAAQGSLGLSMYDRVKRRSSAIKPEDAAKKNRTLEMIKEQRRQKDQQQSTKRVRLESSSDEDDGNDSETVNNNNNKSSSDSDEQPSAPPARKVGRPPKHSKERAKSPKTPKPASARPALSYEDIFGANSSDDESPSPAPSMPPPSKKQKAVEPQKPEKKKTSSALFESSSDSDAASKRKKQRKDDPTAQSSSTTKKRDKDREREKKVESKEDRDAGSKEKSKKDKTDRPKKRSLDASGQSTPSENPAKRPKKDSDDKQKKERREEKERRKKEKKGRRDSESATTPKQKQSSSSDDDKPKLVTKAAMKALVSPTRILSPVPETLDTNEQVSSDIVEALKRQTHDDETAGDERPVMVSEIAEVEISNVKTGDRLVVMDEAGHVQECVVEEAADADAPSEGRHKASMDIKDEPMESVETYMPKVVAPEMDEDTKPTTHQLLSEQKSGASSHVDEVIDDIARGYMEIDADKLIKMSKSQQAAAVHGRSWSVEETVDAVASNGAQQQRPAAEQQQQYCTPPPATASSTTQQSASTPISTTSSGYQQALTPAMISEPTMPHMAHQTTMPAVAVTSAVSFNDVIKDVQSAALSVTAASAMPAPAAMVSSTPPSYEQFIHAARHILPDFLNNLHHGAVSQTSPNIPAGPQFAPGVSASYGAPPHAAFPTAAYIAGSSAAYGLPATLTNEQARALFELQQQQVAMAARYPGSISFDHREMQQQMQQQMYQAQQQLQQQRMPQNRPTVNGNDAHHLGGHEQQQNTGKNILDRYPVQWQGHLALKNVDALVQMHLIGGNRDLISRSLNEVEQTTNTAIGGGHTVRINQRMRLEQTQLDGVQRRIDLPSEHCVLLALPCGLDKEDIIQNSRKLQVSFIEYLTQKQAAGIVNVSVPDPQGNQLPTYVVHVFPPCEFSQAHLEGKAADFLASVQERQTAYLFIVITTVNLPPLI